MKDRNSLTLNIMSPIQDDVMAILAFEMDGRLDAKLSPSCEHMNLVYEHIPGKSELTITEDLECPTCEPLMNRILNSENCDDDTKELQLSLLEALYATQMFEPNPSSIGQMTLLDAQGAALTELISCSVESNLAMTGWHPTLLVDNSGEPLVVSQSSVPPTSLFTKFERCTAFGMSGCNSYNGNYKTTSSSGLEIGGIAMTMAACIGDAAPIESAYMKALGQVAYYEMDSSEESMVWIDANGKQLGEFVRCSDIYLTSFEWTAYAVQNTAFNTGGNHVTAVFSQSSEDDGIMSGTTGCSDYEVAYWKTENGAIVFAVPADVPQPQCVKSDFEEEFQYENALKQESMFWEALRQTETYELLQCSENLVMRDADGRTQLNFNNGMLY